MPQRVNPDGPCVKRTSERPRPSRSAMEPAVTQPSSPRRRLALIVGSLCCSALALTALLYTESQLARAELLLSPDTPHETARFVAAALPAARASHEPAASPPGRAE